ncbi:hypothetical protein PKOR_05715 [Pontibacter korlensis]|uniref:Aerotolerance regulator N-terminal domain-containing protein n=1 Tax=Pontibacter korlensis TaxID=400092 RepID=A0A0E3ZCW1_9BACT|nr:hypothetical protein PKOR_05715 [Pontibacter korlensis]
MRVGSLRWLEASASSRWSSIKLNNFWLLVLRCLILILLAVALAQPVWVHQPQAQKGQKAVLVSEELLYTSALEPIEPVIDSLLQHGYTLCTYTSDLKNIAQEKWRQIKNRSTDSTLNITQNHWALLPLLTSKYKNLQDSVWLFTSDQSRYFAGTRPEAIPENIRWIPVATEVTSYWLQTAVHTSPDGLLLVVGQSTREAITYSKHRILITTRSIKLPNGQELQLQRQNDSLQASYSGGISQVQVQQEPLQVAILANEAQQAEVKYLQAAVQAISSYTGFPITLNPDTATADFAFWLRQEELPQSMSQRVRQGLQVWVQQASKPSAQKTSMALSGAEHVQVRQVSLSGSDAGAGLWQTNAGETLLQVQQLGKGKIYTFRSGFSPAWSGLGQSAQLPELLLPILFPKQKTTAKHDVRALDEQQLIPTKRVAVAAAAVPEAQQEPLLKWLILAAALLFIVERWIAGRRSKV